MKFLVILSKLEEEYLVRACESAMYVRKLRQFFLWTQGQFQGLLAHRVMVCVQFGENDEVIHIESLDGVVRDAAFLERMCNVEDGLVLRLARYWRANGCAPCLIEHGAREAAHPLSVFQAELAQCGLVNGVLHGTERVRGGDTFFAMFSLDGSASVRHLFFCELLLPVLHLTFQRVMAADEGEGVASQAAHALSAREIEILTWVMKGKRNQEIGEIVHLSPLTVKNHLQNIYRKLNVHNRVQAIARCYALQLLKPQDSAPA